MPKALPGTANRGSWVVEWALDGLPVEFAPADSKREAEEIAEAWGARGGTVFVYRVAFRRRRRRSWRELAGR